MGPPALRSSRCRHTLPKPVTDTSTPLPTFQSAVVCSLNIELFLETVNVSHQSRIGARDPRCLLGCSRTGLAGKRIEPYRHVRQDLRLLSELFPSNISFPGGCVPLTGH